MEATERLDQRPLDSNQHVTLLRERSHDSVNNVSFYVNERRWNRHESVLAVTFPYRPLTPGWRRRPAARSGSATPNVAVMLLFVTAFGRVSGGRRATVPVIIGLFIGREA
ncbi:MAG: hypothetical protein QOE03_47 [Micromonosporaceae bacterium]|jgi:uncharacterized membrane protein|nr:hypothetical protein [Micromonosporaceae bacterium]